MFISSYDEGGGRRFSGWVGRYPIIEISCAGVSGSDESGDEASIDSVSSQY